MKNLYVRVPGTSANLGSGFDILGLGLDIYNVFKFNFNSKGRFRLYLENGDEFRLSRPKNFIFQAYKRYFHTFLNKEIFPDFEAVLKLDLPMKGGLGSSASALAAGFAAARYVHSKEFTSVPLPTEERFLYELAMMEGHPDNTTPAVLGNFILSYFTGKSLVYFKEKFPDNISLYLFIPDLQTSTNDSRKKLPESYPVSDVICNMSRVATWMKFIQTKDISLLPLALDDKIHTSYRLSSQPVLKKVTASAVENSGFWSLSGSGPTLLIYCDKKNSDHFFDAMKNSLSVIKGVNHKFFPTKVSSEGMTVKEI